MGRPRHHAAMPALARYLPGHAGRLVVIVAAADGRVMAISRSGAGPKGEGCTQTGDLPAPEALAAQVAAMSGQHAAIRELLADIPGNLARVRRARAEETP